MKWALALSGGAAYGLANAGVLQALEEQGLQPDYIGGSSMGAIVGAVYAYTQDLSVFDTFAEELKIINIATLSPRPLQQGLHGGILRQRITEHLEPIVGDATIGDCPIPFVCIAGQIKEPIAWQKSITSRSFTEHAIDCVEPYIFPDETRLIDALLASSAIPVIFSPAEIDGKQYIDLCQFGAIPSRSLRKTFNPDVVIGTDTSPEYAGLRQFLPKGWVSFIETAQSEKEQSRQVCDIVITPKPAAQIYRFDKADIFMKAGKAETNEYMDDIKALLNGAQ